MGIMSKTSRLSERPKAPMLGEIEDDLLEVDESDIALTVGKRHLQNISLAPCASSSQDSLSSLDSSHSSTDQTEITPTQIKESYDKVVRLMDLYANLKDSPSDLEEKISQLKVAGADMSESIAHLKSLSQSIGLRDDQAKPKTSKDKSKAKRKK